jgi:hypothetical protein
MAILVARSCNPCECFIDTVKTLIVQHGERRHSTENATQCDICRIVLFRLRTVRVPDTFRSVEVVGASTGEREFCDRA